MKRSGGAEGRSRRISVGIANADVTEGVRATRRDGHRETFCRDRAQVPRSQARSLRSQNTDRSRCVIRREAQAGLRRGRSCYRSGVIVVCGLSDEVLALAAREANVADVL